MVNVICGVESAQNRATYSVGNGSLTNLDAFLEHANLQWTLPTPHTLLAIGQDCNLSIMSAYVKHRDCHLKCQNGS